MARKRQPRGRQSGSLARRAATKLITPRLIIYTEGKNTEPDYISEFERYTRLAVSFIPDKHTTPLSLVKVAVSKAKELKKRSRNKRADVEDKTCFNVWVLFDRDDHPHIPRARDLAKAHGVNIGFSNPCFELWLKLHFKDHDAEEARHILQRWLKKSGHIPGYDHDKGAAGDMRGILANGQYENAKRRAERINKNREQEANAMGNPYSDAYKMFDIMWKNRRFL